MNRFSIIAIILSVGMLGTSAAAPRVAVVQVKDIYTGLPETEALVLEMKTEREKIAKDQRAVDLRRIIGELQELQARLSNKQNQLDEEAGRNLARSYELKFQEAKTFQQEYENYKKEQEKRILQKEVAVMRPSLNKIMEVARKISKERGYDLVLESTGNTNTGLPFILYAKNVTDLTDDVKAAIKDAGPASVQSAAKSLPTAKSTSTAKP